MNDPTCRATGCSGVVWHRGELCPRHHYGRIPPGSDFAVVLGPDWEVVLMIGPKFEVPVGTWSFAHGFSPDADRLPDFPKALPEGGTLPARWKHAVDRLRAWVSEHGARGHGGQ